MKKYFSLLALSTFTLLSSGCSSLAEMKEVDRINAPTPDKALVNFVRPSIFLGDGVKFELWDGNQFIGTFKSGTMIQYLATPGAHSFMIDPTQGGRWTCLHLQLDTNTVYYLKSNIIPAVGVHLSMASSTDNRIETWNNSLLPVAVDESRSVPVPQTNIDAATSNMGTCNSI